MIKAIYSATVLVSDQDKALDFYTNKLGFEKTVDQEMDSDFRFVVVRPPGGEAGIALGTPAMFGRSATDIGTETGISMVADDVAGTYEQLHARGVEFTEPPQQMPWGALGTSFKDQDGNTFFLSATEQ